MPPDKRILNAMKRSEVHRKEKRAKAQAKLKRRMEVSLSGFPFLSSLFPCVMYLDEIRDFLLYIYPRPRTPPRYF